MLDNANAIGNAALTLSVDTSQLSDQLSRTRQQIISFAEGIGQIASAGISLGGMGFGVLTEAFDGLRHHAGSAFGAIQGIGRTAFAAIAGSAAGAQLGKMFTGLRQSALTAFAPLQQSAQRAFSATQQSARTAFAAIAASPPVAQLGKMFTGLQQSARTAFAGTQQFARAAFAGIVSSPAGVQLGKMFAGMQQSARAAFGLIGSALTSSTASIGKAFSGAAQSARSSLGLPSGAIWNGMGIAIGGQLVRGIESILRAPFTFVNYVRSQITEMFHSVEESSRAARGLGVPTSFVQSLQLAGLEANNVHRGMERIARLTEGALSGNVGNQATLAGIGIQWQELRGAGLDQVFSRMADQIAAMEDPMARVQVLHQVFGRQAVAMVPLFERGAEGLRQMRLETERLGFGVTDAQAAQVHDMTLAWNEVKLAVQGVWTQIGIGLAPALTGIGRDWRDFIADLMPTARTLGVILSTTAEVASAGFRVLLDWIRNITSGFAGWSGNAVNVRSVTLNVLQSIAQGAVHLWDTLRSGGASALELWNSLRSGLGSVLQGVEGLIRRYEDLHETMTLVTSGFAAAEEVSVRNLQNRQARASTVLNLQLAQNQDLIRNLRVATDMTALNQFFDRLRNARSPALDAANAANRIRQQNREMAVSPQIQGSIYQMQAKIRDEIEATTNGWSHQRAELERLAVTAGNVDAAGRRMFDSARQAIAQLEGLQLTEHFEPSRAMSREFDRLGDLFRRGAIDATVYAQGVNQAMTRAEQALHLGEFKFAGVALGRSQEAVSTILRGQFGTPVENQQQRMQRILEEQQAVGQQQLVVQRQMLEQLNRGNCWGGMHIAGGGMMAVIECAEDAGRKGNWEFKGSWWVRTYSRSFKVVTDNPTDDPVTVMNFMTTTPIFTPSLNLGSPHPTDPMAIVQGIVTSPGPDPYKWHAQVNYSNQIDPSWMTINPLDRPVILKLGSRKEKESLDQAWQDQLNSDGTITAVLSTVLNSAKQPYDPPLQRDREVPQIILTQNVSALTFNPFLLMAYRGAVNLDTYRGCPPASLRVADAQASEQLFENLVPYYTLTWTLELNVDFLGMNGLPGGWRSTQVLDRGLYERVPFARSENVEAEIAQIRAELPNLRTVRDRLGRQVEETIRQIRDAEAQLPAAIAADAVVAAALEAADPFAVIPPGQAAALRTLIAQLRLQLRPLNQQYEVARQAVFTAESRFQRLLREDQIRPLPRGAAIPQDATYQFMAIKDPMGKPVTQPMPLDGNGRRLPQNATNPAQNPPPVYTYWNLYADKLLIFTGVLP